MRGRSSRCPHSHPWSWARDTRALGKFTPGWRSRLLRGKTHGWLHPDGKKPHSSTQSQNRAELLARAPGAVLTCLTWHPDPSRLLEQVGPSVPCSSPRTPSRTRSPPGPPRPSAEPCSPLPPWLRHLRWHLEPRTARACHPRPATAWSPGIRLASPGTSRHGPSPAGPTRAGATVAKRRKPTGRCREKTTSSEMPCADWPSTAILGCRKGWWEWESLVQPPAPLPRHVFSDVTGLACISLLKFVCFQELSLLSFY